MINALTCTIIIIIYSKLLHVVHVHNYRLAVYCSWLVYMQMSYSIVTTESSSILLAGIEYM